MPDNGSGVASPPGANYPAVANTLITAANRNAIDADIYNVASNRIAKDGQTTVTANIPLAGFKLTGVGPATARTDAATLANVVDGTGVYVPTVGGTADAITLTPSPAITAYAAGQKFRFIASGTNTGGVTVATSGLAVRTLTKNGTTALIAGDIASGALVTIQDDGTRYQLIAINLDVSAFIKTLLDDASATAARATIGASGRKNRIHNGSFAVDQRVNSATSRADDVYGIDCWYTLTQTAAIQVTQQTLQENGQPFNIRLTQNQAAAQRMGVAQIIEARDSQADRGKAMVLSARVRISNSQAVRYAILEWTGTADAVTSDVVLDWTSSTYTANNFFLAANLTITAVGSITPAAATWTDITALAGTLGSSVNNQIVFFWTEGTAAQNVTFDVGLVQLEPGTFATEFEYRPFEQELALCMRYYEKSFNYVIPPAAGADLGCLVGALTVGGAVVSQLSSPIRYSVAKRTSSTTIVTTYNPIAANAFARNLTRSTDATTTTVTDGGEKGAGIQFTGLAAWTAGDRVAVQWDASADL